MRSAVNVIGRLMAHPQVQAVAVVDDASVLQSRFDDHVEALRDITKTVQPILKDLTPALRVMDFTFSDQRLWVVPAGARMVLLATERSVHPEHILQDARDAMEELAEPEEIRSAPLRAAPTPTSEAAGPATREGGGPRPTDPSPSDEEMRRALVEIVSRAAGELRSNLGGPVVRNYFTRARRELGEEGAAILEGFAFDLEGNVSFDGDALANPRAAGPWVARWLAEAMARAERVLRGAASLDLEVLAGRDRHVLRHAGFAVGEGR